MALYVNNKTVTYFDFFGVEHFPKEIMKFIRSEELRPKRVGPAAGYAVDQKNIITNIHRIQAYDSIMCHYFCYGFINSMFKGNSLTDYTNLFSPKDEKNDDIIFKYFSLYDVKMSESNLEVSKANEMSELNDLTAEPSSLERSAKHVTKIIIG